MSSTRTRCKLKFLIASNLTLSTWNAKMIIKSQLDKDVFSNFEARFSPPKCPSTWKRKMDTWISHEHCIGKGSVQCRSSVHTSLTVKKVREHLTASENADDEDVQASATLKTNIHHEHLLAVSLHLFHLLYPFLSCLPCDSGCKQETELKPKSRPFERWKYSYQTHGTRNATGSKHVRCTTNVSQFKATTWKHFGDSAMSQCQYVLGFKNAFSWVLSQTKSGN